MNMKKYNINDYMYIQITPEGWLHLEATVGEGYIKHCIKSHLIVIDAKNWYRLQCHQVFDILPINFGGKMLFNSNVMFEDAHLS